MVTIVKSGKNKNRVMRGTCPMCGCKVKCLFGDTKTLIDRDTQPGMATQHVSCPECKHEHLWVQ